MNVLGQKFNAQLFRYISIFIHNLPVIKVRQFWIPLHYFFYIFSHNSDNIVNLEWKLVNWILMQRNNIYRKILYINILYHVIFILIYLFSSFLNFIWFIRSKWIVIVGAVWRHFRSQMDGISVFVFNKKDLWQKLTFQFVDEIFLSLLNNWLNSLLLWVKLFVIWKRGDVVGYDIFTVARCWRMCMFHMCDFDNAIWM